VTMKEVTTTKLDLSLLASEVLLSILEEYYTTGIMKTESIVIDKLELENMFDHVVAKDVLESMVEYGTSTNLPGIMSSIREITLELKDIDNDEVIELDFTHILEAV